MSLVATGLSANGDITALKKALTQAGFDLGPLQLIGPDDSREGLSRGMAGSELLTSDTGTSLPGLNSLGGRRYFRNESLPDRLGDLEIPDSEMDNYVEALERGRSVVAYFAHAETIDRVLDVFRESGLANVRRF